MKKTVVIYCKNTQNYHSFPLGTSLLEIYNSLNIKLKYKVVAARVNYKVEDLNFLIYKPKDIEFIDSGTSSGMRVYVRTLSMVLSKAVSELFPHSVIRIEHPISKGYYCNIENTEEPVTPEMLNRIKTKMQEIIDSNEPVILEEKQTEQVKELFRNDNNNTSKDSLFDSLAEPYLRYYRIGKFIDYYTSILLPVYLAVIEHRFPDFTSLTNSSELDVICYILVVSIGLSILFNMNASSGGLDIVAKIMNKYLHIELGKAMSISGMCVALSSALIYDKKAVVLSVLGTYFNGIVLDHFIFGQNLKRRVCIITKYEEEVRQFILHELHSGATFYEATGAYNMQKHREIITIVDKSEYQKLMNYIIKKDPEAFVTVYTVSDMRYRPKVKSF